MKLLGQLLQAGEDVEGSSQSSGAPPTMALNGSAINMKSIKLVLTQIINFILKNGFCTENMNYSLSMK